MNVPWSQVIYRQVLIQGWKTYKHPEKAFAGHSIMTAADLLQLPSVRGKLIFSQFSDKDSMQHLLGLQLWHEMMNYDINLIYYKESTEAVKKIDKLFIDLFNKVGVDNIDDNVENLLKARFKHESSENYPKDAMHMYAVNEPAMKRNEAVLNDWPSELYTIEANDTIPDNCIYPLATLEGTQNLGGLDKLLKLEIGAKVMLIVYI